MAEEGRKQSSSGAGLLLWLMLTAAAQAGASATVSHRPTSLQFYLHDAIFTGASDADTSVLVAAPGGELSQLGPGLQHYGDIIVIDDPLTSGPSPASSPPIGYARGSYVYAGRSTVSAFWAFTAQFERVTPGSSLTFVGGEIVLDKVRQLPVISGTGDFHMARGMATISTTSYTGISKFSLLFNITLSY